jgi:hypothetical protein
MLPLPLGEGGVRERPWRPHLSCSGVARAPWPLDPRQPSLRGELPVPHPRHTFGFRTTLVKNFTLSCVNGARGRRPEDLPRRRRVLARALPAKKGPVYVSCRSSREGDCGSAASARPGEGKRARRLGSAQTAARSPMGRSRRGAVPNGASPRQIHDFTIQDRSRRQKKKAPRCGACPVGGHPGIRMAA